MEPSKGHGELMARENEWSRFESEAERIFVARRVFFGDRVALNITVSERQ